MELFSFLYAGKKPECSEIVFSLRIAGNLVEPVADFLMKPYKNIKAAMAAPSDVSIQPWSFVVVSRRETLDELSVKFFYAKNR